MTKGRRLPLWANFILIPLAVLAACVVLFIAATLITDWANGVAAFSSLGDIWFSIFPGLKQTAEEVVDVVEPVVEALM